MAEAQVETPPTSNKFFCHRCNVEIPRVLPVRAYCAFVKNIFCWIAHLT